MAEKMLVTVALNELKTLDSRINKAINQAAFVEASKISEKNAKVGKTKVDFSQEAKAALDSINDLIARREKIKAAVIASNAVTEVEIAGQKMTVAKAIDTKESIGYKSLLLEVLKDQFYSARMKVNKQNEIMNDKIDKLIETAYGKEGKDKISEADYDAIATPYKKANEFDLVDPIGAEAKIKELDEYIEKFNSTVDSVLQISNCVTYIEIE